MATVGWSLPSNARRSASACVISRLVLEPVLPVERHAQVVARARADLLADARALADRERSAIGGVGLGETPLGNHDLAERIVAHRDFAVILAEHLALHRQRLVEQRFGLGVFFGAQHDRRQITQRPGDRIVGRRVNVSLQPEQFAVVRFAAGLVADAVVAAARLVSAAT